MSRRTYIDGMQHDCMVLSCEIAEIKTKPTEPYRHERIRFFEPKDRSLLTKGRANAPSAL